MKALKIAGIVIGGLVILALLLGNLLPREYVVERTIEIDAPPSKVFGHVNNFRKWQAWSPWVARDNTLESSFSGPAAGVGAKNTWTSEASGSGSQVITLSEPFSRIETDLDFGEQGTSKAYWQFEPTADGTKVTWGLTGEMPGPVGGLLATQMDSWVGADYEDGLQRLKRVVEGS